MNVLSNDGDHDNMSFVCACFCEFWRHICVDNCSLQDVQDVQLGLRHTRQLRDQRCVATHATWQIINMQTQPFVDNIKRQLEQQYRVDVLRFESVFSDYEILLRRAHELHVRVHPTHQAVLTTSTHRSATSSSPRSPTSCDWKTTRHARSWKLFRPPLRPVQRSVRLHLVTQHTLAITRHAPLPTQVVALETALAAARQELSESQKTQLSLSKQLLQTKDELTTVQCVQHGLHGCF